MPNTSHRTLVSDFLVIVTGGRICYRSQCRESFTRDGSERGFDEERRCLEGEERVPSEGSERSPRPIRKNSI